MRYANHIPSGIDFMSLPRGGFVILAVTSLWVGFAQTAAQVSAQIIQSDRGGITGGTMYLLRFADEVTVPPIEDLKRVIDWLNPSITEAPITREARIDSTIRAFRESRQFVKLWDNRRTEEP
jgi:hypothetical protein